MRRSLSTTADGTVLSALHYSAYGEERYASGDTPTDYRYTGQLSKMGTVGLYYYNARWYDPYLNRFLSPDSIVPDPYNPLDNDRYSYARNNPIKYTDPTGHIPACDKDDWACQHHWDDPVVEEEPYTPGPLDPIIEIAVTTAFEPLDWMSMAESCMNGDCSPFMVLGLLPGIPGSLGNKVDNILGFIPSGIRKKAGNIPGPSKPTGPLPKPKGGVYTLTTPDGKVVRVGYTKDFGMRERSYKHNNNFFDLNFNPIYYTDDYATRRGLEKYLYDQYNQPPLNIYRPISPTNGNINTYIAAASRFLYDNFGVVWP